MQELGEAVLANAFEGFNNCLFAYGQTGAGKTHSMLGGEGDQRGLLPRVLEALFNKIENAEPDVKFTTKVSYLEIYNDNLRDLLVPVDQRTKSELKVLSNAKMGTFVAGLREVEVTKYGEVRPLIDFGQKTRTVAATSMNATSSRSHCIFTFNLEKEKGVGQNKRTTRAEVNLVDLAGSERQSKTEATGQRLKEGAMINQSLSTLAAVINKLAEISAGKKLKGSDFVPFRNSTLTMLLKESLSGNSKTVMVAAISPARCNLEETYSTLRFAQTCKKITTKVVKNQDSRQQVVDNMKTEIEKLKADLLAGKRASVMDPAAFEEAQAMKAKLEEDKKLIEQWEEQRALAIDDMALSMAEIAAEMGIDPNTPQLINISNDPSLNGCLVYYLPMDQIVQIGSSDTCKVRLTGLGMQRFMCSLANQDNKDVTLELLAASGGALNEAGLKELRRPCSRKGIDSPGRVLVNGRMPLDVRVPMKHYDRLIIGHAYCFRLTIPCKAETASTRAPGLTMSSMEEALYEIVNEQGDEFAECQALMESLKDRIGSREAEEFLTLFGRTLPLIEEVNLITSTVRPKDKFRFQVEVTSDIMRYTSDKPELIVRLFQGNDKDETEEVVGLFELPQFIERLSHIREVYTEFQLHPEKLDLKTPGKDPWLQHGYNKIQEMLSLVRHDLDEERYRREFVESEVRLLRRKLAEAEARTRAALGAGGLPEKGAADPLDAELNKANEDASHASSMAQKLLQSLQKLQQEISSAKDIALAPAAPKHTEAPPTLAAPTLTAPAPALQGAVVPGAKSPAKQKTAEDEDEEF